MKMFFALLLPFLIVFSAKAQSINGINISKKSTLVTIENKLIAVRYDLARGNFTAFDKIRGVTAIYRASSQVNDFNTQEIGVTSSYLTEKINEKLGSGAALVITSKKSNYPDQLLKIKLFANQTFVILQSGIKNRLKKPYTLHKFSPIANASLFKGLNIKENFRLLDGEGGGIETYIRKEPTLLSQNNMVLNFGKEGDRHTLVAGGASYQEFEKFASLKENYDRVPDLLKLAPSLSLVEYLDLGNNINNGLPKYLSIDKFENKTKFKFAGSFPEAKSIIYDPGDIKITLNKLNKNKSYTLGLVWGSNYATQKQTIFLLQNGIESEILPATVLPDLSVGKDPHLFFVAITPTMMQRDFPTIVIRKNGGSNTVLSEAILLEGIMPPDKYLAPVSAKKSASKFKNVQFNLFAEDPVGKLVDAGQTYLPDNDSFYLDFSTVNPLISAEKYANNVKKLQGVQLNYYYFPTICLWYAMQPLYGGGAAGSLRAINDSPGAVEEMQRVKNAGWLKYTTMGIRLVPDCYAQNNENGWWDDEHWQMYGSGNEERQGTKEMGLADGHYRKPYETSEKWASAIKDLGGLPFFYFQAGVRSKDYAEAFPNHMLHNQSFYPIGGKAETLNFNFGSYDFSDTSFKLHMQKVYKNLFNAGIKGIMFDYPHTAWAPYGGMDDKYSTTASHYRKVFELAAAGLGENSYNQERNITRGSDLTMGVVQSQRIWGDIDVITPEMIMRGGLRWYKNRVLFNYDMDAKSLTKALPNNSDDGINKLLTISYVTASRLLIGQSFAKLDAKQIFKLSRIFPYHQTAQSARPVDAFSSDYPRVYDFEVTKKWHQLTFFNEDDSKPKKITVNLSGTPGFGGMGLSKQKRYYIFDFWNNAFVGEFKGSDTFKQTLRKGEARMMAVHEKENHPQVLSTNRHLMQGFVELSNVKWKSDNLSGVADMVEHEPLVITIATNGKTPKIVNLSSGSATFKIIANGLMELKIRSAKKGKAEWRVEF